MRKIAIFSISLTILLCQFPRAVSAEEKALGIFPPIVKVRAKSPSHIEIPFRIINTSDNNIETALSIRPFDLDDRGRMKLVLHKDYTTETSLLLSNVRLKQNAQNISKLILSSHQEQNILLEIDIEERQSSKDFYFSIVIQSIESEELKNSHSRQVIGVASNVLLSIGDTSSIISSKFSAPFFTTSDEVNFEASFKNISNHYSTIYPRIVIKNLFGNTIEVIDLKEHNVLPGQTLSIGSDSDKIATRKRLVGPYKAVLELNTISSTRGSKETSIIVFPLKYSTFIFLGIIFIIGVILKVRSRKMKLKAKSHS